MDGRKKLIFPAVFALAAVTVDWLIQGETSPFYQYFIWHAGLPNFWAFLNTIPYVLAIVVGIEWFHWVIFLAHWFIVGYLLSALWRRK